MTRFLFKNRSTSATVSPLWKRRVGLVWLCLWLSIAAGFGYRHLTHEVSGVVQASLAAPTKTKPIEQIQVGERVAFTINPTESLDTSLGMDVDPRTWRKITLRTENGSHEIVLLRPESWIEQHEAHSKSNMKLAIPEVGIDGLAEVLSIEPCPPIAPGDGRIVISTFTHIAPETICMYLEGLAEPIRCTPNHITWSVEHRDFVEAHELQPGNLVLCDDGVRELVRVEKLAEPVRVYNLEVQGQHVYQVSSLGMLVHNVSPGMGNIGSHGAISSDTALTSASRFLGPGYREIAPGVYRSADGLRQFRMTTADLLGSHGNIGSHVHFEALNRIGRVIENLHIPVLP